MCKIGAKVREIRETMIKKGLDFFYDSKGFTFLKGETFLFSPIPRPLPRCGEGEPKFMSVFCKFKSREFGKELKPHCHEHWSPLSDWRGAGGEVSKPKAKKCYRYFVICYFYK